MSVNEKMTAIADAIRAKTGGTGPLTLDGMAEAIKSIEEGGGEETIGNYYVFGGTFIPSEDISSVYELATDASLGLPDGYIYKKRNFLFGAVWITEGYLYDEPMYVDASMSPPKQQYGSLGSSNSARGAIIKGGTTVSREVIMLNGSYVDNVSLTFTTSNMAKAGAEYTWIVLIPKE